jgi:hypothetical protein
MWRGGPVIAKLAANQNTAALMMDSEEREIFYYLKGWQKEFISPTEICRRAGGKKRFREHADWAKPVLMRMVEKGVLETDSSGYYRIKPLPKRETARRWVSPAIARILQDSGKDYSEVIIVDADPDSYYDTL